MKLTLGKKLGIGFGVVLALMVLSAILTYVKASAIKETQKLITSVRVPTIKACTDLQRDLNQSQNKGRQAILAGNESARWETGNKAFIAAWDDIGKDVAVLDELSPRWTVQANRDRLAETKKQLVTLREIQETLMKQATNGEREAVVKAGNEYADQATATTEAIKKPLGEMADSFSTLIKESTEEMNGQTRSMNLTMGASAFAGVFIGVVVAFFIIRDINAGANREKSAAHEVAQGAERERLVAPKS